MNPRPVRATPDSVSAHRSRSEAETRERRRQSIGAQPMGVAAVLGSARRRAQRVEARRGSVDLRARRVAHVEHVDDPRRRASRPWRPARRARGRRTPRRARYSRPIRRRRAPRRRCRSPTRRRRRSTATGARLARAAAGSRGARSRPGRRRRARRRARRAAARSSALGVRRRGGRRDRSPRNTSSAMPSAVPNRLRLEHVEPAHRERAGDRGQQPGPVGGDDGDRDALAVARRHRTAAHRPRAARACSTSLVDLEREHVRVGQPLEERGGVARRAASTSAMRRSSATAAASPRSIAAAALTNRSRTSAAFVVPHAAGPVARESPIVSTYSRRAVRRRPRHVAARLSATAASERSRRVAVSAISRWLRTSHVTISRPSLSSPMRRVERGRGRRRRPRSGRRAGPCRCRGAARRAAAARAAGTRARRRRRTPGSRRSPSSSSAAHSATASSRCRSTVNRWYALRCGRARTCSHSGSSRTSTPTWSSASNTGIALRAGAQQAQERGALPHVPRRVGHRRAAGASVARSNGASISAAARAASSARSAVIGPVADRARCDRRAARRRRRARDRDARPGRAGPAR